MKTKYYLHNAQGAFLAECQATSIEAAKRQFKKAWDTKGCEVSQGPSDEAINIKENQDEHI